MSLRKRVEERTFEEMILPLLVVFASATLLLIWVFGWYSPI